MFATAPSLEHQPLRLSVERLPLNGACGTGRAAARALADSFLSSHRSG